MKRDKLKVYLLLAFMGIVCAVVLLIITDIYVPTDPGRSNLRQSPVPVRATATSLPSTLTLTPSLAATLLPSATVTPSPYPTRVEDATPIPTPIFIPINPPYAP